METDRLDEIKARLNEVGSHHPDVVTLLAAVEAVLALHKPWAESNPTDTTVSHVCEACLTANGWGEPVPEPFPCPTVTAISAALGEEQ